MGKSIALLWGLGIALHLGITQDARAFRKVRFVASGVQTQRAPTNQSLEAKEVALQKVTTSRYTESWSLWAWNKQGWSVFALFLVSRVHPFVGTRVGVQLSVYDPQGRVEHKLQEFPYKDLKFRQDRLSLQVAKHSLTGHRNVGRFVVQWDTLGMNLQYTSALSGFRQYGGPVRLGANRYVGVSMGPRLRVLGNLQIKGKTIPFAGVGYAERSWQDVPHDISRRWFNMRAIHQDYTVIATDWLPLATWQPRQLPSLSIAYKGKWIVHVKADDIQRSFREKRLDAGSGYWVPQYARYRAKLSGGGQVELIIRAQRRLHRLDVLSHVPGWLRSLVQRLITKPFLFRYQNTVTLKISRPGQVEQLSFPGLSEWVFLNP